MKKFHFIIVFMAVVSIALGFAPVLAGSRDGGYAAGGVHALVLMVAQVVFLLVLPRRFKLPMQIFIAMLAGIGAGWAFAAAGDIAFVRDYVNIFGRLFILLLKLVVTPLIFVSVLCGVAGIGDVRKLGPIGAKTILYYVCTTAVAVVIGLGCVNLMRPGIGKESLKESVQQEEATEAASRSVGRRIQEDVLPKVIQNPVMAGQNPLTIILFALVLGAALAALGPAGEPALKVFQSLDKAFVTIVLWVMVLAPLGVFALMADAIGSLGIAYILTLAKYFFTVMLGLATHFAVLTFVVCSVFGRISPLRFLRGMAPAFEVAFSTSSSSATLPVTIECASKRVGSGENICNFMLPVGATVNMDGTALYTAVASVFIAQVYGVPLGIQGQVMVFLTAVMVSVGTAGIPGGSIALIPIILMSAGIPAEGVGIIIGVDRFLDMSRTVVNITGDSVGTVVLSRSEGLLRAPSTPPPIEEDAPV